MVVATVVIFHYTSFFAMKMATPRSDVFEGQIHFCVILEKTPSSGFTFSDPTFPLIFTHNTDNLKISRLTKTNEKRDECIDISNARIYSKLGTYTIWEILQTKERTIDFANTNVVESKTEYIERPAKRLKTTKDSFVNIKSITIDSIVSKILCYKVVYFVNLPADYYTIFQRINHEFQQKFECRSLDTRMSGSQQVD